MKRIQQRRGKKLPPGAKSVARPSRWGNPYRVEEYGRDNAIDLYRLDVVSDKRLHDELSAWLAPLRDATALACYCKEGEPCHADVLIELLEREAE